MNIHITVKEKHWDTKEMNEPQAKCFINEPDSSWWCTQWAQQPLTLVSQVMETTPSVHTPASIFQLLSCSLLIISSVICVSSKTCYNQSVSHPTSSYWTCPPHQAVGESWRHRAEQKQAWPLLSQTLLLHSLTWGLMTIKCYILMQPFICLVSSIDEWVPTVWYQDQRSAQLKDRQRMRMTFL